MYNCFDLSNDLLNKLGLCQREFQNISDFSLSSTYNLKPELDLELRR